MEAYDDDFKSRTVAFENWLQSSGATLSDNIELADLRQQNAGRGVVARSNIEADEELFRIPRTLLLNTNNSAFFTQQPNLHKSVEGQPWLELILTMMYEHGQGANSTWKPYFDVLPAQGQFETLMYWDEAELRELEASAVVNKIGKETADKSFKENIWPSVKAQPELFGFSADVQEHEVLRAAHRIGSLIMAYAFDIETEREKEIDEEGYVSDEEDEDMPKAMVPLADILNADADRNNARLFYEPDALVMKAVKPIYAGDEIFNDYGPLPRSDLLRRYGYITDNYAKYDVVEISSDLIMRSAAQELELNDAEIEQRISHLQMFEEILEEGYDISRPQAEADALDIFSPSLKLLIIILTLPKSSLPPTIKPSKVEKLVARNEFPQQWYQLLIDVLKARQAQYPSSLDEDKQHLVVYKQRIKSGMWLTNQQETQRKFMALDVRVGEKEVLQHAIAVLETTVAAGETGEKRKAGSLAYGNSTPKKTKR